MLVKVDDHQIKNAVTNVYEVIPVSNNKPNQVKSNYKKPRPVVSAHPMYIKRKEVDKKYTPGTSARAQAYNTSIGNVQQ